ncbi:tRNA lysidine(34) synthetase TilS [Propionicimonas sp.]|uniref:tRNA lysidine(34) synthetase TilS n=1 Tax=Propionicimonas sp. TaxID=1955623 RepID=UPI0017C1F9C8|nr:tRNA lysidine(34) synthetase TilS [Propionicimonas sp.]MBU3975517.1 tRNA lysidine(34) synthetase TilS [Actinomycetota bacterium]MBA3020078.1 tRNA lysidine(34) synthetase TilS [Propionicimonas sp.]MBU3986334.1 tRNA lysidine(34) synthetase TilS [Actinomycetota bacterium]MBU4007903.1 tRNA lysidine(34) synthetase TilS [Actinomycetota bacterium]MBU4064161.1 tRNA lysidine(34) synthetase TilS [Actinomycetota bacterium]
MARRALGPATLQLVQALSNLPSAPLLVACSGGPDSLALAAAAAVLGDRRGTDVRAVVVDHGLQAGSAQVAGGVVEQLTTKLSLPAVVVSVVVVATASGPEAAARAARYAALEAAATDSELVLLGHTLDDQAETVLLGLARGSGPRSLAGMPAVRGRFHRPLLGLRRQVTEAACVELGLAAWVDPHNSEERFARVRVRQRVLPVLEAELGPGVAEALARSAALARADADLLDELAAVELGEPEADLLDCARLAQLAPALRSRVLRAWLLACGAAEVSAAHLAAVTGLVTDWHGQRWVEIPGLRVSRSQGSLRAVGN